ncbi:hypothetical protein SCHPADRAFT_993798 [Schizopora paradoxa]|uniref:Uncharacterized protein n=1 Tax=Schizopora paradoxa TaxID=27342 RepID=A0A0H2S933_9AGAM|nr:hypothetical protein SCHPADRAFT_993798 [Schizopora paradoxa]
MAAVSNLEDGTRSFESELHEVLSSWIACKEAIPKLWKGDVEPIKPMSYSDLQVSGMTGCSHLVSRARKTMLRLTSLSNTLRELSTAIQAEAEAAQENFEVVSNMCNLIFLPNELLDRSSIHLARFSILPGYGVVLRFVMENISGSSDIDLLCLSRSKDARLDVYTEITLASFNNRNELVFEQSLIDALPHSRRWRSLDIQFVYKRSSDQGLDRNPDIRQAFREIDVHLLESLCITNIKNPRPMFEDYHEFKHWVTPNLRHLTSDYYVPLLLPGLANLVSLNVTLKPRQIILADFHQDLSRMKNLESLALKLDRGSREYDIQLEPLNNVGTLAFRRVRHLKIEMESQWPEWIDVFKPFFSNMSFPNAVDLHVKLCGYVSKTYPEEDEAYLGLSREVESIIQHDTQFPRVERFWLEAIGLNIGDANDVYSMEAQQGEISLSVPLALLPNIKHFTLSSNGRPNPRGFSRCTSGAPLPVPALETISIQIIKLAARKTGYYVKDLLTKQKKRGEWGEFIELIVKDNDSTSKGRINMKTYAKDDALEWCERKIRTFENDPLID